jgi:hypothetical protein
VTIQDQTVVKELAELPTDRLEAVYRYADRQYSAFGSPYYLGMRALAAQELERRSK